MRDYDEPYDDALCDDCGNEYMKIDDHDEEMQDFKNIAIDILKEMVLAIQTADTIALKEAIDEMAEHLGATI
jgi:uncharacterized cysteine cluster protein YcgN (CxxCxxCC family)